MHGMLLSAAVEAIEHQKAAFVPSRNLLLQAAAEDIPAEDNSYDVVSLCSLLMVHETVHLPADLYMSCGASALALQKVAGRCVLVSSMI